MTSASNNANDIETTIDRAIRNERILELILQDLPFRDLKNCRFVSSKWNNLALKEIQAKNWNDRNILNFDVQDDQRTFLETYLNMFSDSPESLPHSCHKFGSWSRRSGYMILPMSMDRDLVRKFCETFKKQMRGVDIRREPSLSAQDIIEICGESLEELGISSNCFNEYHSDHIIKNSSMNQILLPKLKSISLDMVISTEEEENVLSQGNQIFKHILSNMRPNSLEELNFHNFGQFHSAVEALIEFNQINNLQKLALYPNATFYKGSLLMFKGGINLQLKQLRIHNVNSTFDSYSRNCSDIDPDELCDFLVTQRKSLENLNLICSIYLFPSNMLKIKTLKICVQGKEFGNTLEINFVDSFPNLKNLCMWTHWWDSDQQIISEQKPCYSVIKLSLPVKLTLSVGPVARILRTFPRLSSLEVEPISSEGFQTIWNAEEFADTLKVLILWISGIPKGGPVYLENALQLDEILSGVSGPDIGVAEEKCLETFISTESQPNSILKLKNLEKLHLNFRYEYFGHQVHLLTDFVGFSIFDKMKNLTDLFIHRNTHRFSAPCIARLKTGIPNFSCEYTKEELDRRSDFNFRQCQEYYLKTRMSKHRMHRR